MTKLVLSDIDGTLLSSDGAGKRAIRAALLAESGTAGPIDDGYRLDGKTDPQIVRELLAAAGHAHAEDAERVAAVCRRYLTLLGSELAASAGKSRTYPGVTALLDLLDEGVIRPTAQQVAERSGVSLRSIFRIFDDVESLNAAACARQVTRVRHLFIDVPAEGDPLPAVGTVVEAGLGNARRRQLMRNHSGLHVGCGGVKRDFGALGTGSNIEGAERSGQMLAEAANPRPPWIAAPRSVRMSPNRFEATPTSSAPGTIPIFAPIASICMWLKVTSG